MNSNNLAGQSPELLNGPEDLMAEVFAYIELVVAPAVLNDPSTVHPIDDRDEYELAA